MKRRVILLRILLALPVILGGLIFGAVMDAREVMLAISLIIAVMLSVFLHYFGDRILLRWYHAVELRDERLNLLVKELAMRAGMKCTPKLYVISSDHSSHRSAHRSSHCSSGCVVGDCGVNGCGVDGVNADCEDNSGRCCDEGRSGDEDGDERERMPNVFSVGRDAEHASIVMTRALLDLLDEEELKAVLGHELAHIRRGEELLISTMIAVVSGVLTALATIAYWISLFLGFGCEDDPAPNALRLFVLSIVALPASLLIHLFIPAVREHVADVESVRIHGANALKLMSAIDKMERSITVPSVADKVIEIINPAHAHLFFINPLRTETVILLDWRMPSYNQIFNTHPPTSARKLLLLRRIGGRDDTSKTGITQHAALIDGDFATGTSKARRGDREEEKRGFFRFFMRKREKRRGMGIAKPLFYSFISYMLVLFMLIVIDTFNRKDFDFKRSAAIFVAYMIALLIFYMLTVFVFRMRGNEMKKVIDSLTSFSQPPPPPLQIDDSRA